MIQSLDPGRPLSAIVAELQRVIKRFPDDPLPIDQIAELAEKGEIQVFPVGKRTVFVCQLFDDMAYIVAAAGEMAEVLTALPEICEWYARHGAREIRLRGREGWRRTLAGMGWRPGDYDSELVKGLAPAS